MIKRQDGFDEAGNSGGDLQMADIGFDRSDGTKVGFGSAGAERLTQRLQFDRIAERRTRSVGFYEADRAWVTPDRASASFTAPATPSWLGAR